MADRSYCFKKRLWGIYILILWLKIKRLYTNEEGYTIIYFNVKHTIKLCLHIQKVLNNGGKKIGGGVGYIFIILLMKEKCATLLAIRIWIDMKDSWSNTNYMHMYIKKQNLALCSTRMIKYLFLREM